MKCPVCESDDMVSDGIAVSVLLRLTTRVKPREDAPLACQRCRIWIWPDTDVVPAPDGKGYYVAHLLVGWEEVK